MNEPRFLILSDESIVNLQEIARIEREYVDCEWLDVPPTWSIQVYLRNASESPKSFGFSSKEQADDLYTRLKEYIELSSARVFQS
jgi:hypothetical protein